MAKKPFPGVTRAPGERGKVRWRLRRTIKGRKIDTYLPGVWGSAEFRAAYEAAISQPAPKTAGRFGTFDHVISAYRGHASFTALAPSTRYSKGKRLDAIREKIGPESLYDLLPHHIENMMDRKGGPHAANRLLKELSEL